VECIYKIIQFALQTVSWLSLCWFCWEGIVVGLRLRVDENLLTLFEYGVCDYNNI